MVNVCASYSGGSQVLSEINLHIEQGEIVTILGANGAGKSTILKTLCGWLKPTSGDIIFNNIIINNLSAQTITRHGIAISPEGRRVFQKMTVLENLEMGAYIHGLNELKDELNAMFELFPKLFERKKQSAGSLSGGEQQMLAIARAMMSKPKLLLLDEPSLGLSPIMVDTVLDSIKVINDKGVMVCLVEQNAQLALEISKRGYVLENGRMVMEGNALDLLNNEKVKSAYLGL